MDDTKLLPVILKPSVVAALKVGTLLSSLEERRFQLESCVRVVLSAEQVDYLYPHHLSSALYLEARSELTGRPSVLAIFRGSIFYDDLHALKLQMRNTHATSLIQNAIHMPRNERERVRDLRLVRSCLSEFARNNYRG